MELVAATKMRRAAAAVLATRRYAELAWELLRDVRSREEIVHHPLLEGRAEVRRRLVLVVAGNRGLVGAFNQNIVGTALHMLGEHTPPSDVVTAGRVAARLLQRAGKNLIADFPKKDVLADPAEVAPIAEFLLERFITGEADRVDMVYADFLSPTRHEPRLKTLLPIEMPAKDPVRTGRFDSRVEFLFEPTPTEVLQAVVPNLVSVQIYQALLETTAAEHAARMVSMQNATDNAEDLVQDLTLTLNQVRQQQITRELQEIVSGTLL